MIFQERKVYNLVSAQAHTHGQEMDSLNALLWLQPLFWAIARLIEGTCSHMFKNSSNFTPLRHALENSRLFCS